MSLDFVIAVIHSHFSVLPMDFAFLMPWIACMHTVVSHRGTCESDNDDDDVSTEQVVQPAVPEVITVLFDRSKFSEGLY